MSGIYSGTWHYYNYAPGETTIDEYTNKTITVNKWGKDGIDILGHHFLTDSLRDDGFTAFYANTAYGNYVHFKEDSLIYYEILKFKFGYNSYYKFRGVKQE